MKQFIKKHAVDISIGAMTVGALCAMILGIVSIFTPVACAETRSRDAPNVARTSMGSFDEIDLDAPLGKNLLDLSKAKFNSSLADSRLKVSRDDDKFVLNGLKFGATFSVIIYDINYLVNDESIISLNILSGSSTAPHIGFRCYYKDGSATWQESELNTKHNSKLTVGKTIDHITLILSTDNVTFTDFTIAFQVEKGTTATDYERFYSFNSFYNYGYNSGHEEGYQAGYNVGYNSDQNIHLGSIFTDGLAGILDFVKNLLNIEVWGISLYNILGSFAVVILVVSLLKMVK